MSRPICPSCQRPPSVCYCNELVKIENQLKVVILQHPSEEKHPFNTGRIVNLCLLNSELIICELLNHDDLSKLLSKPSLLLYPSLPWMPTISKNDSAKDSNRMLAKQLIVIDATWKKSKKILHLNPELQKLDRLSLSNTSPSKYKIRKSTQTNGLSTVESVVSALRELEPSSAAENMLKPFNKMVERQQSIAKGI